MEKTYIIKELAKTRWFYTFTEKNSLGEKIVIELLECFNISDSNSIPTLWVKYGYTKHLLHTYLSINTYVTDTEGFCYNGYNPQLKKEYDPNIRKYKYVIDFDWLFEATAENKQKLIDEVYRRASNACGITAAQSKKKEIRRFATKNGIRIFKELPEGWKIMISALTAPCGSLWICNMKPLRSGEREKGLLLDDYNDFLEIIT